MELKIEVSGENASNLQNYLQEAGFECQREIRKALGWPETLYVLAASLSIIDTLYSWLKSKKKNERETTIIIITDRGSRINLDSVSPDKAKELLKEESDF